jgi:hypothetical protein
VLSRRRSEWCAKRCTPRTRRSCDRCRWVQAPPRVTNSVGKSCESEHSGVRTGRVRKLLTQTLPPPQVLDPEHIDLVREITALVTLQKPALEPSPGCTQEELDQSAGRMATDFFHRLLVRVRPPSLICSIAIHSSGR